MRDSSGFCLEIQVSPLSVRSNLAVASESAWSDSNDRALILGRERSLPWYRVYRV